MLRITNEKCGSLVLTAKMTVICQSMASYNGADTDFKLSSTVVISAIRCANMASDLIKHSNPIGRKSIVNCFKCDGEFGRLYDKEPVALPCLHHFICRACLNKDATFECSERDCKTYERHEFGHWDRNNHLIGLPHLQASHYAIEYSPMDRSSENAKAEDDSKNCVECNVSITWHCLTCNAPYCINCFRKTHSEGKVMRQHIFGDSANGKTTKFFCDRHEHLPFVYFCDTCRIELCERCNIVHGKHETTKITSKNMAILNDARDSLTMVEGMIVIAEETSKRNEGIRVEVEERLSAAAQNVSEQFIRLHTVLQHMQTQVLDHITHDMIEKRQDAMDNCASSRKNLLELQEIRRVFLFYQINVPENVLLEKFIEETLKRIRSIPKSDVSFDRMQNSIQFLPFNGANIAEQMEKCLLEFLQTNKIPNGTISDQRSGVRLCSRTNEQDKPQLIEPMRAKQLIDHEKADDVVEDCSILERSLIDIQRTKIAHIDSPSRFFMVKPNYRINQIKLNKYAEEANICRKVDVNILYLVQKPHDLNWHRAKVCSLHNENEYLMIFVDYGYKHVVKKDKIKFLSSEWRKLPNAVVPCSLYGIICIGNKWNCESISFMKKHLNGKNCVLLAMNSENKSSPLLIVDILFNADSEKKSLREYFLDKKLAVSNMGKRDDNLLTDLVECQRKIMEEDTRYPEHKAAPQYKDVIAIPAEISHGGETDRVECPGAEPQHHTKTEAVAFDDNLKNNHIGTPGKIATMSSCTSPSEFYLQFNADRDKITQLQYTLQTGNSMEIRRSSKVWMVGDKCCVRAKLPDTPHKQWYRGRIPEINDGKWKVFLRDYGISVSVTDSCDLRQNIEELEVYDDLAVKCSLACVAPLDGHVWSLSAAQQFHDMCQGYRQFDVLSSGSQNGLPQPVILWGLKSISQNALEPTICEWVNINEQTVVHRLAQLTTDISCAPKVLPVSEKLKLNEWPELVSWIPPKQITQKSFSCFVTYVSRDMIIYYHDTVEAKILRSIHNSSVKEFKTHRKAQKEQWHANEPCMAMYTDDTYYRATVLSVSGECAEVLFIDYGNVETCKLSDLSCHLLYTDVPAIAQKCRLPNIKPPNDDSVWPLDTIEFFIYNIVETKCHVKVSDDDILSCNISDKEGENLRSTLISRKLAKPKIDNNSDLILISRKLAKSMDTSFAPEKCSELYLTSDSHDASSLIFDPDDLYDVTDYQRVFEMTKVGNSDDMDNDIEEYQSMLNGMMEPDDNHTSDDQHSMSTVSSIDDVQRSHSIDQVKLSFEPFRISYQRQLVCRIESIVDGTNVIIAPESAKYTIKFDEMMVNLQIASPNLEALNVFEANTKCVAYSVEDKLWKRAIISKTKLLPSDDVDIIFVDSLEICRVDVENVRSFPPESLFMLPVRFNRAQLYGLKPNRRLRSADIENELLKCLTQIEDKAYVKVVSSDPNLNIEIYSDHKMKELVYSSLLEKRFYSKSSCIPF